MFDCVALKFWKFINKYKDKFLVSKILRNKNKNKYKKTIIQSILYSRIIVEHLCNNGFLARHINMVAYTLAENSNYFLDSVLYLLLSKIFLVQCSYFCQRLYLGQCMYTYFCRRYFWYSVLTLVEDIFGTVYLLLSKIILGTVYTYSCRR